MLQCLEHLQQCVRADLCQLYYSLDDTDGLAPSKMSFCSISSQDDSLGADEDELQPKRLFRLGARTEAITALVENKIVHQPSSKGCVLCVPLNRKADKCRRGQSHPFGVVILEVFETLQNLRIVPTTISGKRQKNDILCNCGSPRVIDKETGLLGPDVTNRIITFLKSAQHVCYKSLKRTHKYRLHSLTSVVTPIEIDATNQKHLSILELPIAMKEDENEKQTNRKKKKTKKENRKKKNHLERTNRGQKDTLPRVEAITVESKHQHQNYATTNAAIEVLSSMASDWETDNTSSAAAAGVSSWTRRSSKTAAIRVSTASKLKQKDTRVRPVSYSVRKPVRPEGKARAQRGLFLNWLNKTRQTYNHGAEPRFSLTMMQSPQNCRQRAFDKDGLGTIGVSEHPKHTILPSLV